VVAPTRLGLERRNDLSTRHQPAMRKEGHTSTVQPVIGYDQ
jgi:hypothetical protein